MTSAWVDGSDLIPTELPVPTLTGYTFTGWYYEDELLTGDDAVSLPFGSVLTARWEVNTYTIVFHSNGGESSGGGKRRSSSVRRVDGSGELKHHDKADKNFDLSTFVVVLLFHVC